MERPPIYLKSKFISHPSELFTFLRDSITWDERMRARKTASFGVSYNYSQISYEQVKMLPELENVCGLIELELGFRPNNCLLNYYLDGNSSVGFHSDSSEELAKGTGVAIVSLGAVRAGALNKAYRLSPQVVRNAFSILSSARLHSYRKGQIYLKTNGRCWK